MRVGAVPPGFPYPVVVRVPKPTNHARVFT
jgi:hypothetical protein